MPGEKILEEIPLLKGGTEDVKRQSWLEATLAGLSNTKRKKFYRLYNAFPEENEVGIMRTNCYGLGLDNRLSGIFEKLSRLNHSCLPNAERWWDIEREVEMVHAIRNIEEGDEITVAYTGVSGLSRSERQTLISTRWRFECYCECCQLSGPEAKASDERRQLIGKVDDMVGYYPAELMIGLINEALDCLEKEGIFGALRSRVCYDGYQLALQTQNLKEAKRFIKMAYEQSLLGTGETSEQTKKMLKYVQDPTSHILWGL